MRKIVICDDMELERLLLKDILIQYFEEIQEEVSIIEYSSGEVLVADAEEGYLEGELLFLDIYMDQLNGMETARKLSRPSVQDPHCISDCIAGLCGGKL